MEQVLNVKAGDIPTRLVNRSVANDTNLRTGFTPKEKT
jgi:hypothetical protein